MADVSIIVSTNANKVAADFKGLTGSVVNASARAKVLSDTMKFLDTALNKNKISAQQYSVAIQKLDRAEDALYKSIGQTTSAVRQQGVAVQQTARSTVNAAAAAKQLADRQRMAGKSTNKFGMYTQQVGYQVGDFFVQVQSGTDALVAFGQQGTQLAGLLPGLAGAVLGIGLAISTALGRAFLESKNLTINFKAVKKSFADALEPIKPMLDAIASAFSKLGDVVKTVGTIIANNIARLTAYAVAFAGIIGVKLVAAFIFSGKAATMFFRLVKVGLISTGIGAFVVALGEILYRMQLMITNAGSLGLAWAAIRDVFAALWEYGTSAVDIYVARLKTVGPIVRTFIYGTINSILYGIDTAINFAIKNLNKMLDVANLKPIAPINLTGLVDDKLEQAANDLLVMEAAIEGLKGNADVALQGLLDAAKRVLELAKETGTTLSTSDWLTPDTDGEDSELSKLLREQKQRSILAGLYGKEYNLKKQIFEVTEQLDDEADSVGAKRIAQLAKINVKLEEQEKLQQRNKDLIGFVADSMGDSFMAMVDGTKSVKDAFREMASDIVRELYRVLVVQQMVNAAKSFMGFADGGAFSGGSQIQAYADGGVVGSPTFFGMSGGKTGLMGEAGPEAILPLKRGANGKLGVQMEGVGGGVTINQNINISTGVQQTVRTEIKSLMPQIAEQSKAAVLDAKRRGGSYGSKF